MKAYTSKTNVVDNYFLLLKNLSPDNKLELISKLSNSLKNKELTDDISWKSLFGALKLDKNTDDFIEDLKKDRNFTNKEEIKLF